MQKNKLRAEREETRGVAPPAIGRDDVGGWTESTDDRPASSESDGACVFMHPLSAVSHNENTFLIS